MSDSPVSSYGPEYFETLSRNAEEHGLDSYTLVCEELALADTVARFQAISGTLQHGNKAYTPYPNPNYACILSDFDPDQTRVIETLILARTMIRASQLGPGGFLYRYSPDETGFDRNGQFARDLYMLLAVSEKMSEPEEFPASRANLVWYAESNLGVTVLEKLYREKEKIKNQTITHEIGYINIQKTRF